MGAVPADRDRKPFNRVVLAFDHAERLRAKKKFKEAADFYAMVPAADPRHVAARFLQMINLTGRLDERRPDKKPLVQGNERAARHADPLARRAGEAALAAGRRQGDRPGQEAARTHPRRPCTLTAAQIAAAEQKDLSCTLTILANFERETWAPAAAQDLIPDVLQLRVGSYMQSGQYEQATQTLKLNLLNKSSGEQGQMFVLGLLQKIDEDFRKAIAGDDTERAKQLAGSRARSDVPRRLGARAPTPTSTSAPTATPSSTPSRSSWPAS